MSSAETLLRQFDEAATVSEAEEALDALARMGSERGDDPYLELLVGNARMDADDPQGALKAFDRALELARAAGDEEDLGEVRAERRHCRQELGLEEDEDDRLAPRPTLPIDDLGLDGEDVQVALAWFRRKYKRCCGRL